MIFSGDLCDKVMDGTKTVTRRPVKKTESDAVVMTQYLAGKDYAVQPKRGACAVGRLLVLDIRIEPLDAITDDEALAEGFADRQAFLDRWLALYGRVELRQPVWRIRFELVSA